MSEQYIEVPIETDPAILEQDSFDYFQAVFPEWVPNDANVETILIEAVAKMTAEARDVASAVPTDIFRYFGALVGIETQEATFAVGTTDWVMIDNQGYTIPAGTQIGIEVTGDLTVPFETIEDVVIPEGFTDADGIQIRAIEEGADASGISGLVSLIDTLDFVSTITLVAPTSGGEDAEDDDEYLNRLRTRLQLLAPRPILARDFAIFAQDIGEVERAVGIDNYLPTVTNFTGNVTNGSPTVTSLSSFNGITVGSWIQGANIPYGSTVVSIIPGTSITLSKNATGTNGGNAMTSTGVYGQERAVTVSVVDEDGLALSTPIKNEVDAYLEDARELNFIVEVIDPVYTAVDVNFVGKAVAGWDPEDVETRAEEAIAAYLSPANWGLPRETGDVPFSPQWINQTVIRYLELAQVINNVSGMDYITALTFRRGADTFATTDITLAGAIPMPTAGSVTGDITL